MQVLLAAADSDPLAIPTFIIALLGLVGSVIALVWQFVTFGLSGARVKVEVRAGYRTETGATVYVNPHNITSGLINDISVTGYGKPEIAVTIRSVGRMKAVVSKCLMESLTLVRFQCPKIEGPNFPFRMEPGEVETWRFDGKVAVSLTESFTKSASDLFLFRAIVELGDGRRFRSREPSLFPPPGFYESIGMGKMARQRFGWLGKRRSKS